MDDEFRLCPKCGKRTLRENCDESWTCLECRYREDASGEEITTERILFQRHYKRWKEHFRDDAPSDDDSWREKIKESKKDFDPWLDD